MRTVIEYLFNAYKMTVRLHSDQQYDVTKWFKLLFRQDPNVCPLLACHITSFRNFCGRM